MKKQRARVVICFCDGETVRSLYNATTMVPGAKNHFLVVGRYSIIHGVNIYLYMYLCILRSSFLRGDWLGQWYFFFWWGGSEAYFWLFHYYMYKLFGPLSKHSISGHAMLYITYCRFPWKHNYLCRVIGVLLSNSLQANFPNLKLNFIYFIIYMLYCWIDWKIFASSSEIYLWKLFFSIWNW